MAKYIVKRVFMALVTLLIVACITFFLMNAIPGNPWLSEKTPPEAVINALNEKYGLDQPLHIQLGKYLGNLLQGDLGVSIKMQKNREVLAIITEMFPVSAKVGIISMAWATIVGVTLGCLAAHKRGTWLDSVLRVVGTMGISMPGFVVATLLLLAFCSKLGWFPVIFDGTPKSYVLPCLALGFYPMCYLSRQTRTAMLDAINQEYIKTARAKGLKNKVIIFKHALRNALIPVIAFLAVTAAELVAGTIVVEQVFAVPGVGRLLLASISGRDFPVAQAIVVLLAAWVVIVNFIADILYQYMDPRIRIS